MSMMLEESSFIIKCLCRKVLIESVKVNGVGRKNVENREN